MSALENDNELYHLTRINHTVVIEYRKAAFSLLMDVASSEAHMNLLRTADDDSEINGIVLINDKQYDEAAGMQALLELLRGGTSGGTRTTGSFFMKEKAMATFRNLLGRRLLLSLTMTKPQVVGFHGNVTSEYLGIMLPFDARIATPDTCFNFSNVRWGLPPSPGLSYFLPRFIGQGKALDLIQHAKVLTAEEALSLGLITVIVPYDQLRSRCLEELDELAGRPAGVVAASRMLINPDASELERHIERYIAALIQAEHRL